MPITREEPTTRHGGRLRSRLVAPLAVAGAFGLALRSWLVSQPVETNGVAHLVELPAGRPEEPRRRWRRVLTAAPAVVVVTAAVVMGAALRAWLAFHQPINSDEAVVGLMARQILAGHLITFFWGQQYGGTESYVVAALFGLFGQSPVVLKFAPALMAAIAAVEVWRIARHLVASRSLAALAGALAWVAPASSVAASTAELGFRGVTLAASLGCLLACLRLLDGSRHWHDVVAAGLLAGVAWWSSPESVYILLPAFLILLGAAVRGLRGAPLAWGLRLWVFLVSGGVGAAPWLAANLASGFASLRPAAFGGTASQLNPGYLGRLDLFVRFTVPMQFDLRLPWWGRWVIGGPRASAVAEGVLLGLGSAIALVFVVCLVLCAARGGRCLALLAALAAFPFLYAENPGTWFWSDGRYALYLGPLLALVLVTGMGDLTTRCRGAAERARAAAKPLLAPLARLAPAPRAHAMAGGSGGGVVAPVVPGSPPGTATEPDDGSGDAATNAHAAPAAPRPRWPRVWTGVAGSLSSAGLAAVALIVAGAVVLGTLGIAWPYGLTFARFVDGWSDPNTPVVTVTHRLESLGLDDAYAGYWIAYKLDFAADGQMAVATVAPDIQPRPAYARQVRRQAHPAWLFVPSSQGAEGLYEFGSITGPAGYSETAFEGMLEAHRIGYQVVKAGLLQAVIPTARVTHDDLYPPLHHHRG